MTVGASVLQPDLDFIRGIKAQGGESVKKCFQCSTCAGTCPITPNAKPFPRKEMLWATWGLKDRLVSDPDIWLCHQCNDCSDVCPRGGNPGDVIAAIRNQAFRFFAVPGFMGAALSSAKFLPLLFAFPVVILLAFMGATGHLGIPEGTVIYDKMLYHAEIFGKHISGVDFIFVPFAGLMGLMMALSVAKMWKAMDGNSLIPTGATGKSIVQAVIEAAVELVTHKQFGQCETNKPRFTAHLLVFYGFGALFITTLVVMAGVYLFDRETPMRLSHPVKIFANAGALAISVGLILALLNRMKATGAGKNNYYDWVFYLVLAGVVATGVLSELLRLADVAPAAYPTYFLHIVFVFFLIVYMPYSKFAHMVYRFTAIVWAKKNGRHEVPAS